MLTQGFLPAKGVGGSAFPPSLLFPWLNPAAAATAGSGNARLLRRASSPCGVASRGEGFAAAGCFWGALLAERKQSVSLGVGCTRHCPAVLLFASRLSVCLLHLPKTAPARWLWLSAGFRAVGALLGSVKPPPLLLFINIGAKYRLFKLSVAVQILIAGFISRSGGAGRRARVCSWGSSPYTGRSGGSVFS